MTPCLHDMFDSRKRELTTSVNNYLYSIQSPDDCKLTIKKKQMKRTNNDIQEYIIFTILLLLFYSFRYLQYCTFKKYLRATFSRGTLCEQNHCKRVDADISLECPSEILSPLNLK